jgi:hypothetical protein
MQLTHDHELEKDTSPAYGKYLGTFISERGQVRAHLFDNGVYVVAYVSFLTGMNTTNVEDRYVAILEEYAAEHGFSGRFRMVHAA